MDFSGIASLLSILGSDGSFPAVWWKLLILAAASYLLGSVSFAILISRAKHRDIRTLGSGNPGSMNMLRNFGAGLGGLTLLLGISPLQYMAGMTGPIGLLVITLGFLAGDKAFRGRS